MKLGVTEPDLAEVFFCFPNFIYLFFEIIEIFVH